MNEIDGNLINTSINFNKPVKKKEKYALHILLFILTFLSCTLAGVQWAGKNYTDLTNFEFGLTYGILIITFLTAHEFGHYIASRIHKVEATLPFYIPFPPSPGLPSLFGTFGAVIKTRTPILSRKALFDIGVAGPIAGFIVALIFLVYGLLTLPGIDYIYNIHPEYLLFNNGRIPETSIHFGDNLLYYFLSHTIANPNGFLPPMNEIYHYPFLNVGWFGLFVTTLNMIPIGQLDGGHITYAMFGGLAQERIAKFFWWSMMLMGISGTLGILYEMLVFVEPGSWYYFTKSIFFPPLNWVQINASWLLKGWSGWLFWGFISRVFIKIKHPPIQDPTAINGKRMIIGWLALIILFLSISYNGIYIK